MERALERGIDHAILSSLVAGGSSFADFDGDGWDDVTLATERLAPIYIFKNIEGKFQQIYGLIDHRDEAKQVLWVDFDNDGDKDFFVATFGGPNRLYENIGDLVFNDITESAGLPINQHRAYGACWGDYDRDGFLDLYVSERKFPLVAGGNENRLFKNNGNGTFTETTDQAGVADRGKIPFCSAFLDVNNDGWPDIYTANDKGSGNTLLLNNTDGTFTDISSPSGSDIRMEAMSVTVGDYDNDGWQDIYITNVETGNVLLKNRGFTVNKDSVFFEDVAVEAGVALYEITWGANFFDADNDGHLDLYVSGSIEGAAIQSSRFYLNKRDGTFFTPSDVGFKGDTIRSLSNSIGDYNQNGYPDIIVANNFPYQAQLWNNSGTTNHWLKVFLQGVKSNREAIGSKIEVYADSTYQMRYTHSGIAFLGQNSLTETIGLGFYERVDSLIVSWPTGHIDKFYDIEGNQTLKIIEGSSTQGEIYVSPDVQLNPVSINSSLEHKQFTLISTDQFLHIKNTSSLPFSTYQIIDIRGRLHLRGKPTFQDFSIPISNLSKGMYIIQLFDQRGRIYVKKWVKH